MQLDKLIKKLKEEYKAKESDKGKVEKDRVKSSPNNQISPVLSSKPNAKKKKKKSTTREFAVPKEKPKKEKYQFY